MENLTKDLNGGETLCLNSTWLDSTIGDAAMGAEAVEFTSGSATFQLWTDPWNTYHQTYWPNYTYERKISLKLSEVMYLRELAAEDKKLRKILKKFAPHIEITVDFPGSGS